jgi:hypothetical protein
MSDSTVPGAGWYIDPDQPELQRYWDGAQWTNHTAPAPSVAPPAAPSPTFAPAPFATTGPPAPTGTYFTPEGLDQPEASSPAAAFAAQYHEAMPDPGRSLYVAPPEPTATRRNRHVSRGAVALIIVGAIAVAIAVSIALTTVSNDGTVEDAVPDGVSDAVPFSSQQRKAADAAARSDVATLGIEIQTYVVDSMDTPTVNADGTDYVVSGPSGEVFRMPMSDGVEFGGWTAEGPDDWCLWVTAPQGAEQNYHMTPAGGSGPGNCS